MAFPVQLSDSFLGGRRDLQLFFSYQGSGQLVMTSRSDPQQATQAGAPPNFEASADQRYPSMVKSLPLKQGGTEPTSESSWKGSEALRS